MTRATKYLAAFCVLIVFATAPAGADDATEARLRDALRGVTAQLSDAQEQIASLQAKLAAAQQDAAKLRSEGGSGERTSDAGAAYARAAAEFNRRLAGQNQTAARWQAAYNTAAETARAAEGARAQLATDLDVAKKSATACEAKNQKLFDIATEILRRYGDEDMSDALASHEPFLGLERVELQNLMQDDADKLRDNKVKP
ncbi:MAG: hypothetical protein WDM86_16730 [Rhizomicrobium sp.]